MKLTLKKLGRWIVRRLKEPSTYIGATTVAVAVGASPTIVEHIGTAGLVVPIILGAGVAAATTSQHPPVEELLRR